MKRNEAKVARLSAGRKVEIVLRVLRGEDLDAISREIKRPAAEISSWRDQFLKAGEASMKSRQPDGRDGEVARLKSVIGEMTVQNELMREGIRKWKAGAPFVDGRSKT